MFSGLITFVYSQNLDTLVLQNGLDGYNGAVDVTVGTGYYQASTKNYEGEQMVHFGGITGKAIDYRIAIYHFNLNDYSHITNIDKVYLSVYLAKDKFSKNATTGGQFRLSFLQKTFDSKTVTGADMGYKVASDAWEMLPPSITLGSAKNGTGDTLVWYDLEIPAVYLTQIFDGRRKNNGFRIDHTDKTYAEKSFIACENTASPELRPKLTIIYGNDAVNNSTFPENVKKLQPSTLYQSGNNIVFNVDNFYATSQPTLSLYNSRGVLITKKMLSSNTNMVSLNSLWGSSPNGVYVCVLNYGNVNSSIRVVKK